MTNAKDILLRQPIVVCPLDHAGCKAEMEAIEQSAKDAAAVNAENPMLPLANIIKTTDPDALHHIGFAMIGRTRKLLIE